MSVSRNVHFCSVAATYVRTTSSGTTTDAPADLAGALRYVRNLPFDKSGSPSAYLTEENGAAALSAHVLDEDADSIAGVIGRTRYDDLPQVEVGGHFKYISIPVGGGVFEGTHFVYYPSSDLAAFEFNSRAPRWTSLRTYILDKLYGHANIALDDLHFVPIINQEVLKDFEENKGGLGKIQVKVFTEAASLFAGNQASSELGNVLRAACTMSPTAQVVTLEIGAQKATRRGSLADSLKQELVGLVRSIPEAFGRVSGRVERTPGSQGDLEDFDLLKDRVIRRILVADTVNGVIDSNAVIAEIRKASASQFPIKGVKTSRGAD